MLTGLTALLAPNLLQIINWFLAVVLIPWLALQVKNVVGIVLEKNAQDNLHRALMSGAEAVLNTTLADYQKVDAVIDYAKTSVPGAMKKLKPLEKTLQSLAKGKLNLVDTFTK